MCFTKNSYIIKTCHRGVAQSGSVFVWGAKGRGFESRHSDQNKKYRNAVFFVLLWCHNLNTINCTAISGSTNSRFCKRQRSENVTIAPQAFMPRVSRHSDHQFSLLRTIFFACLFSIKTLQYKACGKDAF